ncbi:unnamed protein product [Rotaria magnacalcarata]|uniref:IQ domain-containing protein K n=1 Tax=Rotaria magnacalcarata TaxID=392030 RepID=A0A818XQ85_9BILA|nr:unnamed protein product [Rotaria magnacalcarata]CAF2272389.1 unnamed protein product [Rotaria magnacalcarata]CAF3744021.1 unnamed protein product [Rotaria magnacalcarata]CAF3951303.1 unnamed protein product [Rotaria magnacalcarata]
MPIIIVGKETNLWQDICSEFAIKRAQAETGAISTSFLNFEKKYPDNSEIKKPLTDKQIYDPSKHSPVFCNYSYNHVTIDDITQIQIDTRISHPACINYALIPMHDIQRELTRSTTLVQRPITPIKKGPKELSTIEYLEKFVYPILLKGIEQLLIEAEKRKCLERKRSAFNALDYLTRYLFYKNPSRINLSEEQNQQLSDIDEPLENIPFVHTHFEQHPRAPLPKSLLWSEEEAALIIQSFYRGYRIRKQPDVQELRQWQREWRDANRNIHDVVEDFWRQHSSPQPV